MISVMRSRTEYYSFLYGDVVHNSYVTLNKLTMISQISRDNL